jgi:hypothetical protein
VPRDGWLGYRGSFYRAPEALVHARVTLKAGVHHAIMINLRQRYRLRERGRGSRRRSVSVGTRLRLSGGATYGVVHARPKVAPNGAS